MKKNRILSFLILMFAAIMPAAAQIVIDEISIEEGSYTVNNEMTVRFKVNNNTGLPLEASDYSLTLNVGGVYAGEPAATKAIANNSYESFVAHIYPHKAGENLPVEIVFKGTGTFKQVADTKVNVAEETPAGEAVVGNATTTDYTNALNTYYNYAQSEVVYKAADLGLAAGTKITGLSFKGYRTNERIVPIKVWIEQTEDTAPKSTGKTTFYTSDNLVKVYDGNYSFKAEGSSTNFVDVFSVDFAEPIIYNGNSIRVLIQTEKAANYSYTYLAADKSKTGQVATRYNDSGLATLESKQFATNSYGTPYYLPVTGFKIDKEPSVVSGTVQVLKKDITVVPLPNATVTLASGNVMYFATTDASGAYSVPVAQDKLTYDVSVTSEDVNLFPHSETLEMTGTSATFNLDVVEGFGAFFTNSSIPYSGITNNPVTVKATIANYEEYELTPANTTITLTLGDEDNVVATATDFSIDALDATDVELTFTPHEVFEGKLAIKVHLNGELNDEEYITDFKVTEEMASGDYTIGEGHATTHGNKAPISLYSSHCYTQSVLTTDLLPGLAPGTKITGLKLWSAQVYNVNDWFFDVKAWMQNTTDDASAAAIDPYSTDLVQVYEGTLQQRWHGNVDADNQPTLFDNLVDIQFSEPFIYTGGNLRVAMQSDIQGSGYRNTFFKALADVKNTFTKATDSAGEIKDKDWYADKQNTPVFTFVVDNGTILSGTVIDKTTKAPIAGATIKITATDEDVDVYYTATTDADGNFEMTVVQNGYDYDVNVSADSYTPATSTLAANFESQSLGTFELETVVTGVTNVVNSTSTKMGTFDLMGRRVDNAQKGVYIINGRKVVK